MTPFAEFTLGFIHGERPDPVPTAFLVNQVTLLRRNKATDIPDDVPKAVREALEELKAYQRIEGDEKGWRWVPEKEEPPAQKGLFE